MDEKFIIAIFIMVFAVSLFMPGCVETQDHINTTTNTSTGNISMETGVNEAVNANNQFAFDIYDEYKDEGNLFLSPYSISTALAMTYEGARGQTADEIREVFHFPENKTLMRSGYYNVYNIINSGDKNYTLKTANALWAQNNYHFEQNYFDTIETYYHGHVTNLDFMGDTENSRITINQWVENQTNDKIKNLIPKGMIIPDTRLVLTNAIYFKGTWAKEFNKNATTNRRFWIDDSKSVDTDMMAMYDETFNYTETDKLQMIELPYSGNELSMLIILPKDRNIKDIERSLTYEEFKQLKNNLKEEEISQLYIPKFKFETKYFMKSTLINMGMPTAFSNSADFSGMTGEKDLKISFVIHQAYIEVDEEGTEAAAATAVGMERITAMPGGHEQPIVFNANHPFIFIIQDRENGDILFMGKMNNPA